MYPKIKTSLQTSKFRTPFFVPFWCCNSTILGSNPDRSPAAQWTNTRISSASRPGSIPAWCAQPGCRLPPPSSQPASASRGPVKTLSPALAASPDAGAGCQKSTAGPGKRLQSKPLPGPALAASSDAGAGFQKSQYWPEIRLQSKRLASPALAASPDAGEGCKISTFWPEFGCIGNLWPLKHF